MDEPKWTLREIANAAFVAITFGLTVSLFIFVLQTLLETYRELARDQETLEDRVHGVEKHQERHEREIDRLEEWRERMEQ